MSAAVSAARFVIPAILSRAAAALDCGLARLMGRTVMLPRSPVQRCVHREVRSVHDLRSAVAAVAGPTSPVLLTSCLRELVEMNTPALLLNIVESSRPVNVVLRPRAGSSISFRGSSYLVRAGPAARAGCDAPPTTLPAHSMTLCRALPDHPVHLVSVEHHGEAVFTGDAPPWLTHFTLVVNGVVVTRAEPLVHERGPQVWAATAGTGSPVIRAKAGAR
jgi:hypothetical protein